MTKWVEVKALQDNITRCILKFLKENTITRFGCVTHLVSDQGSHFINSYIKLLVQEFMITHHKSTIYYPQGNGQAKSTNKTLK
jgi:transposase InsO family protein